MGKWSNAEEKSGGGGRWAPRGRYQVRILEASAGEAKSGATMIKVQGAIEGGDYEGVVFFDNLITDPENKGIAFAKSRLRGLGVDVDSEEDLTDEQIAEELTGKLVFADLKTEPRKALDDNGGYTKTVTTTDENGKEVVVMNNVPTAYYTADVGASKPVVAAKPAKAAANGKSTFPPPPAGQAPWLKAGAEKSAKK